MASDDPLGRATVDAAELVARYPARLSHANKRAVYERVCPAGTRHHGAISVSRWPQGPAPRGRALGFRAARIESASAAGPEAEVVVHTGHWGTGAYGGDRVLMAMVQLIAAKAASIDRLVFHTFDAAGMAPCREAASRVEALAARGVTLEEAVEAIEQQGFEWGTSDGN